MRLKRVLPLAVCGLFALAAAGCFGGGDGGGDGSAPDISKIATATLPAQLPAVRILGESIVSTGGRRTYTIQSGDTLSGVADRFGITLEELVAANPDIDPATLQNGAVITLPESVTGTPAPAATTAPEDDPTSTPEVVEDEEPATEIPPEEPLPTDTPLPPPVEEPPPVGATPTTTSLGSTYIVEAGDSLDSIAARFGYTPQELIDANPGLDPANLQPGQVLILP